MAASGADDPIALLTALIRCPSVTPEPAGVLDVLEATLAPLGFAVTRLRFEGDGSYPVDNLFATWPATDAPPGPHLLFAGHTDVVPPGDAGLWRHPPFAAEAADGLLYGRGAADMKSGVAAFVVAAARAIAAGEAKSGRLSLAITNDEEADSINGTDKLMAWAAAQGYRFDFAIVGEPSAVARVGDSIKIGRRGSVNFDLAVTGIQGHAAHPGKALNPLPVMAKLVTALAGALDAGNAHFPPTNLEFTSLDVGNTTRNVIPARAVARFNIRFNDGWPPERLGAEIERRIATVQAEDAAAARCEIALSPVGRPSRAFLTPNSGALERLLAVIAAHSGSPPEQSTGGGTSDARFIAPYCPVAELGLPGPSLHQANEHVAIADVLALTDLYRAVIAEFLGG
jgi:succinyl-diaminopimelate desuccinylase